MSDRPLVSVVIPTCNRRALLEQAIRSVCKQSHEQWELVVVDDGSTDGTPEFVSGLRDERVRLQRLEHTGNVATVRNSGAHAAQGELLAFLDSDDLWLPNKLERQIERMQTADVLWSYTRYEHMDEQGAPVPGRTGEWQGFSGYILREVIATHAAVAISTLAVQRALFLELGGFDENPAINFREDYDLVLRLAARAPALALTETLSRVREHPGRVTHGLKGAVPFLTTARVYDRVLDSLADRDLRRLTRRRRAWHLAEAGAQTMRAGAPLRAISLFLQSLRDRPISRQWASAFARGLGLKQ